MNDNGDTPTSGPGRTSKVARLIDEYDFDSLGEELERKWTAAAEDRLGLRELADYFNKQLLRAVLQSAGVEPLDGEVENIYRLLGDDDVSEADRIRAQRQLERDGVDTCKLKSEFVSYQSIRTYLQKYRNATYEATDTDRLGRATKTIHQLQTRMDTITKSNLEQLRSADIIDLGDFYTIVDVRVICEDCSRRFEVTDLLGEGGCDCR